MTAYNRIALDAAIYTVGYEGLTIDAYIEKLKTNKISMIVDVRKNPLSRKKGFSKKSLCSSLEEKGIKYLHLPGLGVPSEHRKDLASDQSYRDLFEFYRGTILPKASSELCVIAIFINNGENVALTCFEREAWRCHRSEVARAVIEKRDIQGHIVNL